MCTNNIKNTLLVCLHVSYNYSALQHKYIMDLTLFCQVGIMPELPEVETVRRGLSKHIKDTVITSIQVIRRDLRFPIPADFERRLKGRTILDITRRAKYLLFILDKEEILIVHLGMSGSMVIKDDPQTNPRKHDHVIITLSNGLRLFFHDPRRFGLMMVVKKPMLASHSLFSNLGIEPLSTAFTGTFLYNILNISKAPVKSVIMDQRKLVGVGNIYASEALFDAGVHPTRSAQSISKKESDHLATAIKKVLKSAIASGGSTLRDYVRSSGDTGYFQHHFKVYGRQGLPCLVCKSPILQIRQTGRSTFFCGHCQK
jgi:formamidopyrimidine-DNA glycosylase